MSPDHSYGIFLDPRLSKVIKKNLSPQLKKAFDRKLNYFKENLHHPSLNTKRFNASAKVLRELGVDEIYEFYINMSIRCVFYVVNSTKQIIIAYVGNHEQVKKKFG